MEASSIGRQHARTKRPLVLILEEGIRYQGCPSRCIQQVRSSPRAALTLNSALKLARLGAAPRACRSSKPAAAASMLP